MTSSGERPATAPNEHAARARLPKTCSHVGGASTRPKQPHDVAPTEVRSFGAFEGHTGPVEGPQDLSVGAQKTKDDY